MDFYSESEKYLESTVLESGDVILLACAGRGFEILEPTEMVEVKQGTYVWESDKSRFDCNYTQEVRFRRC